MPKINQPVVVFWFRRDLRLSDNVGLYHAFKSGFPVLPLFIFDTDILNQLENKLDKRVDLIQQMLLELNHEIQKHNSSLLVKIGNPLQVFGELCKEYEIKTVYTNRDYEPYALNRDAQVEQLLAANKVNFRTYKDQVVFEWDEVLKQDGLPYTVFTPYSRVWKKKLSESKWIEFDSENLLSDFVSCESTNVPDLDDIGFSKTGIQYFKPEFSLSVIENYDKTRDIPANEKGTTGLSVHLRFGTVSIRYLVGLAKDMNEIWLNELIWREFFMSIIMHFPYVVNRSFKIQYDEIKWQNDEAAFERWCNGTTGYPIVDAGMRQLNETGLMHNRVRMIVASFLVKDLLIDWRWGEAYFAQKLLDYDLSANNGNWQWAAGCGCDAAPYFRIFNPAEQTKRYDPKLEYIQRWVKELNTFDYPAPIVDHSIARERTLNTFKAALKSDD